MKWLEDLLYVIEHHRDGALEVYNAFIKPVYKQYELLKKYMLTLTRTGRWTGGHCQSLHYIKQIISSEQWQTIYVQYINKNLPILRRLYYYATRFCHRNSKQSIQHQSQAKRQICQEWSRDQIGLHIGVLACRSAERVGRNEEVDSSNGGNSFGFNETNGRINRDVPSGGDSKDPLPKERRRVRTIQEYVAYFERLKSPEARERANKAFDAESERLRKQIPISEERARQSAERARQSAERARQSAERARQSAERARQAKIKADRGREELAEYFRQQYGETIEPYYGECGNSGGISRSNGNDNGTRGIGENTSFGSNEYNSERRVRRIELILE